MAVDSSAIVYRGMTRTSLSAAYNNSTAVENSADWLDGWRRKSAGIRRWPNAQLNIRYASAPRAFLDYFPCEKSYAPLFVFIHGGYWIRNRREMFAFVAEGPVAAGFNAAILGYSLAPDASLTVIVEEMRSALSFLSEHAREYGFRGDKIIVGGWSAGGHLTAALMDHPAVAGILPISGIFDLEPISLGELNDMLHLTVKEIETLSPIKTLPSRSIPVCVAYGALELPELQRQSTEFIEACKHHGLSVEALPLDGHHHFSILDEFSAPEGHLLGALGWLAKQS